MTYSHWTYKRGIRKQKIKKSRNCKCALIYGAVNSAEKRKKSAECVTTNCNEKLDSCFFLLLSSKQSKKNAPMILIMIISVSLSLEKDTFYTERKHSALHERNTM